VEIAVKGGTFSASEIKELNRYRIYLQAFFVSDITEINGKYISPWARSGKRCMERKSVWDWPIQQRPTKWAPQKKLKGIISQYNTLLEPLGKWITTKGHHQQEWFLDGSGNTLFSRHGDTLNCSPAAQIGRLRFSRLGASFDEPTSYTHMVSTVTRNRYVEIKEMVKCQQPVVRKRPVLLPYQSCVGVAAGALQLHVQRLIGDMSHFKLTSYLDCTMEVDIIIATYGSVLFGVGYQSWIIATTDEYILMAGDGPDDGAQDQMASYWSELGGIAAVLGVIGTLSRSGMKRIRGVTLICDNSAAVLASKRDLTPSVFHHTESDFDLIATIKNLEKEWCRDIIISYSWVRGHADRLD
jgi:hypothetical protein